jgi:hypothetical protein
VGTLSCVSTTGRQTLPSFVSGGQHGFMSRRQQGAFEQSSAEAHPTSSGSIFSRYGLAHRSPMDTFGTQSVRRSVSRQAARRVLLGPGAARRSLRWGRRSRDCAGRRGGGRPARPWARVRFASGRRIGLCFQRRGRAIDSSIEVVSRERRWGQRRRADGAYPRRSWRCRRTGYRCRARPDPPHTTRGRSRDEACSPLGDRIR